MVVLVNRAYKFRMYPNVEQIELINKTSTAATVGNMACGGVKFNEAGKISCEAKYRRNEINLFIEFYLLFLGNFIDITPEKIYNKFNIQGYCLH